MPLRLRTIAITATLSVAAALTCTASAETTDALGFRPTSTALQNIASTYSFLLGQEHTLNRILSEYPGMELETMIVRSKFGASFGGVDEKLYGALVTLMGQEEVERLVEETWLKIKPALDRQEITPQIARETLSMIEERANGVIPSPQLETLLAAKYYHQPTQEVLDGYYQEFLSKGHPKSHGVEVSIRLPQSWKGSEGRHPHIVQKWRSHNGTGGEMILLDIREVGEHAEEEDLQEMLRGDSSMLVPQGGTVIESELITLDNQPAVQLDFILEQEIAGHQAVVRARQYQVYVGEHAAAILCQAIIYVGEGPFREPTLDSAKARAVDMFEHQIPVCQQTALSMVLPQTW